MSLRMEDRWARARLLRWLSFSYGLEASARVLARLLGAITRGNPFGIERRLRGVLYAPAFGSVGLQMGRGLQLESARDILVGNRVTLYGGSHYVAGRKGKIEIGDDTHIGRHCVLAGLGGIRIGSGCAISSAVCIYSVSNHFRDDPLRPILDSVEHRKVTIGDDVWIGAGANILPGVTIGDHAVIGAGAVVQRDIPAWQVAVGVPAKVIKDRRDTRASRGSSGQAGSQAA